MPKYILEFNLPEEHEEFEYANNGLKYYLILRELDQFLRSKIKYPPETTTDQELYLLQEIRDKLHELISSENVEI